MNWKDVSEAVAILAIIVSLLLLAYELKRSNDLADADALAFVQSEVNSFNRQLAGDKDMMRVWQEGLRGYESLADQSEKAQFGALLTVAWNSYEIAYRYHERGILETSVALFYAQDLCNIMSSESTIQLWHRDKRKRFPGFYDFINKNCELTAP